MRKEQNVWDVKSVAVGGLIAVLLVAITGLLTGLLLCLLVLWVFSMRECLITNSENPIDPVVMLHSGEIV